MVRYGHCGRSKDPKGIAACFGTDLRNKHKQVICKGSSQFWDRLPYGLGVVGVHGHRDSPCCDEAVYIDVVEHVLMDFVMGILVASRDFKLLV